MLAGARTAVELIDITRHQGAHPRIGAIDVVPVVPVLGIDMEECVELSRQIGERFAGELGIPVYFYERSACVDCRVNLAEIRRGGYEGLLRTGLVGDRKPDVGPERLHPTAGATVVGARGPLIAYNVNLATPDVSIARVIARKIRALRDSGAGMAGVKAIGVELSSRGIAQVSTNITQPEATSIYEVYSFIENEARAAGVEVLESELIGVLRQEALVEAFCSAIKLPTLHESRVLDNWLPVRSEKGR
jgi:glutamate formiminotransferase